MSMSIIVEIAGMAAGMLSEYSTSRGWGKVKTFFVASGLFFTIFFLSVLISPSEKGIFIGMLYALGLGVTLGLCIIGLMILYEKKKNRFKKGCWSHC